VMVSESVLDSVCPSRPQYQLGSSIISVPSSRSLRSHRKEFRAGSLYNLVRVTSRQRIASRHWRLLTRTRLSRSHWAGCRSPSWSWRGGQHVLYHDHLLNRRGILEVRTEPEARSRPMRGGDRP